ncbi:MAG: substrate-binding periplasmic protein [Bryobacteraceae bacterium]
MKVPDITQAGMHASLDLVTSCSRGTRRPSAFPVPFLLALLLFAALACGPLPRDPRKTLQRVQHEQQIRVGVVENPPWVIHAGREPGGVEAELIRRFAASLGAKPKWFWGSEQQHMEALEHFALDVLISGLDKTTPWSKSVGLTRPYFKEQFTIGVPSGARSPDTLKGINVAVTEGEAIAAYVQKKGANPVRKADLTHVDGPLAAPVWFLENEGFTRTKFVILEKGHVMAVPPGENGWLKRLGDYLEELKSDIPRLLTRGVQP